MSEQAKWDISHISEWGYNDPPRGAIIPTGGNAVAYPTGTWRSSKPKFYPERCTNCMICWVNCPDASIKVPNQTMSGVDYVHCKGCGICAQECPVDALEMVPEATILLEED